MQAKPRVFIGSSVENLKIAYAIQENLDRETVPTVWTQGIFLPSKTTLESIVESLDNFDFGIFVFSPDDLTIIRDTTKQAVRDNVIFELGVFIGRLGRDRTYIISPRDLKDLRIPTDLLGITLADYDASREDKNWAAALRPACEQVKRAMAAAAPRNENGPVLQSIAEKPTLTDEEIVAILSTWLRSLKNPESKPIYYAEVDKEQTLPTGSTKKHIEAAANRLSYVADTKGPTLILLKYVSREPRQDPFRRSNRGWGNF